MNNRYATHPAATPPAAEPAALNTQALCERAGVTRCILRLYEREGLLPAPRRTPAGYRVYPGSTVERLQAVRLLKEVGFTLREIAQLLGEFDHGVISDARLRELATEQLTLVESRIARLQVVREALQAVVDGDRSLIDDPDCRLLLDFLAQSRPGGSPAAEPANAATATSLSPPAPAPAPACRAPASVFGVFD